MDYKCEDGENISRETSAISTKSYFVEQTFIGKVDQLFINLKDYHIHHNKTGEIDIYQKIGNAFRVYQPLSPSFREYKINEIFENGMKEKETSVISSLLFALANILRPENVQYIDHFNKPELISGFIELLSNPSLLNKYVFHILANNKDLSDYLFIDMPIEIILENYLCFSQSKDDPLGPRTSSLFYFLIISLNNIANNKELTRKMLTIVMSLIENTDPSSKFIKNIVKLVSSIISTCEYFSDLEPEFDIIPQIWHVFKTFDNKKYISLGLIILANASSYDFIDSIDFIKDTLNSDIRKIRTCSYFLLSKIVLLKNELAPLIVEFGFFEKIYERDSIEVMEYQELYLTAIVTLRFCNSEFIIDQIRKGLLEVMINFIGDSFLCEDSLLTLKVILDTIILQYGIDEAISICDEVDMKDAIADLLYCENESISKLAQIIWDTMSPEEEDQNE